MVDLSDTESIADLTLSGPIFHGTPIRALIMAEMKEADGMISDAIEAMESIVTAAQAVLRDLLAERASRVIEGCTSKIEAAEWFIENVPLDASWRTDAYFMLRERLKR